MDAQSPWYIRPLIIACTIALPITLFVMLIGKLPYSYYRRKFDEPELVEFLRVFAHIGLMGVLSLGWRLYTAIKPKTVYENFMIGPPLLSNVIFPMGAVAAYSLGAPNLALGLIAILLLYWMTFIPYQAGFRWTIQIVDSKEFSSYSGDEDTTYPTGKGLLANAIGIIICSATLGYFAGGVVGAMQTMIIAFSILASCGAWLGGMVHAIYVYGPDPRECARSSASAWAHGALAAQGNPFYCDDIDEQETESPDSAEPDDPCRST